MNNNILPSLPLSLLPHVISLAFTECLLSGDAYIDIFTYCLQGRVAFLHFTDGEYFPTTSEDTPRLGFFPLHHVIILHYLILNHPPHLIPPMYSRSPLSTWHTKLFKQVWRSTVNIALQWNSSVSVQLLSRVWLFATPWTAARQASLSITNSRSLLRLMCIESMMPSNHLILCRPLLLPPWSSYGQEMEAEVTCLV